MTIGVPNHYGFEGEIRVRRRHLLGAGLRPSRDDIQYLADPLCRFGNVDQSPSAVVARTAKPTISRLMFHVKRLLVSVSI
jgi:hypothetical protein